MFELFAARAEEHAFSLGLSAYLYVIETDAWSMVGDEFGFDVNVWRERMAKDFFVIERLEKCDFIMRELALSEDEVRERVSSYFKDRVEIKALDQVAQWYRSGLLDSE